MDRTKIVSKLPQPNIQRNLIHAQSKDRSTLRRSKSFSDLNTNIKPTCNKQPFGTFLKPKMPVPASTSTSNIRMDNDLNARKIRKSRSYTNLNSIRSTASVKINLGKRPMRPPSQKEEPPKRTRPLVASSDKKEKEIKVPPKQPRPASYDYKARFNILNEKHTTLKTIHKELKEKYEDSASEIQGLKCENEALLDRLKVLERDQKRFQAIEEKYTAAEFEKKRLSDEAQQLRKNLNSLTETCNMLQKRVTEYEKSHHVTESKLKGTAQELKQTLVQLGHYKTQLQESEDTRRGLHNTVQDMKGNIRVFCRVRPQLEGESDKLVSSITYIDDMTLELRKCRDNVCNAMYTGGKMGDFKSEFTFDKVFPPEANQYAFFEDLAQLVQSALDGYHVCVFAYGQTGSGKTYTMLGNPSDSELGMIPRSMELLFSTITNLEHVGWEYEVHASFLEIYNEMVRDLLETGQKQLDIRFNQGKGVTVTNLAVQQIRTVQEFRELMTRAQDNRAVAATNFNEHSSRSHAVTKIYLRGTNNDLKVSYTGSINLVDLAGSESAKTSCNERLEETKKINRSLSELGNVILALHNKEQHVPYRNSKLTYLLQSCLGGNSKCLMVVNISPLEDCYNETLSSLRFAAKVKEVKIALRRNKAYMPDQL